MFMKLRSFFLYLMLCLSMIGEAQTAGVLAGANYSRFNEEKSSLFDPKWKFGPAGGIYLNLPLSDEFSVEPQVLYSLMGSKATINGVKDSIKQQLGYISIPLLFKFHIAKPVSLNFGPQLDLLLNAKEKVSGEKNKEAFRTTDVALTGGFELFPQSKLSFYARYIHGIKNVLKGVSPEYSNQAIQAGVKYRLFKIKKKTKPVKAIDPVPQPDTVVTPPPPPPPPVEPEPPAPEKKEEIAVEENNTEPVIANFNVANVQFVTGSARLTSTAVKELDNIIIYLKENTAANLQVNGHTDNIGNKEFNQRLSEKRAATVVKALVKKGADSSRLSSAGFGMDQPIADNSTKEGRVKNRRVEFKLKQ
jgi:outer membrane protein OmpA-like peptidoglycan-associated protein